MPLGELEEEGWHKILIIGAESLFIQRVRELLPEDEDFKYEVANSGFEAGIQAESFHPDTIVIDLAMGRSEGLQIAQNLRRNPAYEATLIVAMASEDEAAPEGLTQYGFNEAFKKPFDIALLAELNPGAGYAPGEKIVVTAPGLPRTGEVVRIEADKTKRQVRAYGADGTLIAAYPATIGSEENPSSWFWFEGNFASYEENKVTRLGADAARPHRVTYRKLTRD